MWDTRGVDMGSVLPTAEGTTRTFHASSPKAAFGPSCTNATVARLRSQPHSLQQPCPRRHCVQFLYSNQISMICCHQAPPPPSLPPASVTAAGPAPLTQVPLRGRVSIRQRETFQEERCSDQPSKKLPYRLNRCPEGLGKQAEKETSPATCLMQNEEKSESLGGIIKESNRRDSLSPAYYFSMLAVLSAVHLSCGLL